MEKMIIENILNKVDKIGDRIDSIDKTLTVQSTQLGEHIKRTEILENRQTDHERALIEYKAFQKFLGWTVIFLTTIATVASGIAAVIALIK